MVNSKHFIEECIQHHGVVGMKWGHRKSQSSGSRTSTSKKPKNKTKLSDRFKKKEEVPKKEIKKEIPIVKPIPKQKNVKDMTDTELREKINRAELENRYKQLNPKQVSKGKKFVKAFSNTIVKDVILPAAVNVGKQVVTSKMTEFTNKKFEFSDEFKVFTNNKKK